MITHRTSLAFFGRAGLLVVLGCLAGCSGKPGATAPTPTSPTAAQTPPLAPSLIRYTGLSFAQRTISINWAAVSGADRYVIEVGSSSGAADRATLSISSPTAVATIPDLAPGVVYVRVKAANAAGVSSASSELWVEMVDIRNVIEALFLGSGPFSEGNRPRHSGRTMFGWAPGSRVSVRVPHEVGGEQFDAIAQTINTVNAVMDVQLFSERATLTSGQYNQLRPSGITIVLREPCPLNVGHTRGCATTSSGPQFSRALIQIPNPAEQGFVWVHEIAHALGLNHFTLQSQIDASASGSVSSLFGPMEPIMGGVCVRMGGVGDNLCAGNVSRFGLSEIEVEAIRRVYTSGLRPGSSTADFVSRGLITP